MKTKTNSLTHTCSLPKTPKKMIFHSLNQVGLPTAATFYHYKMRVIRVLKKREENEYYIWLMSYGNTINIIKLWILFIFFPKIPLSITKSLFITFIATRRKRDQSWINYQMLLLSLSNVSSSPSFLLTSLLLTNLT